MYKKYFKVIALCMTILVINTGCTNSNDISTESEIVEGGTRQQEEVNNVWEFLESSMDFSRCEPKITPADYIGSTEKDNELEWKWKNSEGEVSLIHKNSSLYISTHIGEYLLSENITETIDYGGADTLFYQMDITGDGNDDMVVLSFCSRGTGSSQKSMFICDVYNNKYIKVFNNDEPYNTTFIQTQRKDILGIIDKWIDEGFIEKSGLDEHRIKDLNTEMFIPSIVSWNGITAIRVDFKLIGMDADNTLRDNYFVAILTYNDGEYVLKELYYQ